MEAEKEDKNNRDINEMKKENREEIKVKSSLGIIESSENIIKEEEIITKEKKIEKEIEKNRRRS